MSPSPRRVHSPENSAQPFRESSRRWAICTLLLLLVGLTGCGSDPGPEVWVIGLDGADWDQLDPMIAQGLMPNLTALIEGGASGVLWSQKPLISPLLWTTIATGKSPDQHGVTWFMTNNADGTKTPVSSTQRKVRSFWNVASEAGLSCGVVGWWATWPADPIKGFVVSDHVGWHSFGVTGHGQDTAGQTWPPDLIDTVQDMIPDPSAIPTSEVAAMVNLPPSQLVFNSSPAASGDPINHLLQAMATSRGYTDLVLDKLDHDRPDLLALYYEGTDAVTHLFGDYQPPHQPWIAQADYEAYSQVVDEYWIWQDKLVGELLAERGPETTIIVVSDHGFRVGGERRKEDAFNIETADEDHMLDGVVILNGPHIKPGTRLSSSQLYDIMPTVLYALDLPVAKDLKGKVLTEALNDGVLAAAPVRYVATFETSPMVRAESVVQSPEATEGLEKMLRSLGYISGSSKSAAPATHTAPEEVVNMATVLMNQGRFDEAIDLLSKVAEDHPEIIEVRLNLAQALARSGQEDQVQRGEHIFRELLADEPDRLDFREDLATILLHSGRHAEALEILEQGLQQNPKWVTGLADKGMALSGLGRQEEAVQTLREALREDPRHEAANLACGQVLIGMGRTAEGISCLKTAHHMAPDNSSAALKLAGALQSAQDFQGALQVLQLTLDSGGPQADLLAEKGAALLRMGNTPAAIDALQAALRLNPDNTMATGNLGVAYAMSGEMPSAIATFEKVVALEPDMAEGHAQLGALYAQTGRMDRAEQECKMAVELDPGNPDLKMNLGQVYSLQRKTDEARAVYQDVLQSHPKLVPALIQLGKLEEAQGNTTEARRLLDLARKYEASGRSTP